MNETSADDGAGQGWRRSAPLRMIARLDVKSPNLIKGVRLEGFRKIGDPNVYATKYYDAGADEILYMDIVASLYERNSLFDIVERTTRDVFVPITVGGGIRTVDDARGALRAGADKVAVNTAAVRNPDLLQDIARSLGSQALILSVEAKRQQGGGWEVYTDNGRERTGKDVVAWIGDCVTRGVGEILLTSVDNEGTRKGFDLELMTAIHRVSPVPVILSGGLDGPTDVVAAAEAGADAIAVADALHYERHGLADLRRAASNAGLDTRDPAAGAAA